MELLGRGIRQWQRFNIKEQAEEKVRFLEFRLIPGTGKITVNKRDLENYFGTEIVKREVKRPFEIAGCEGKYDVIATVYGGGFSRSGRRPQTWYCKSAVRCRQRELQSSSEGSRLPDKRPENERKKEIRLKESEKSRASSPRDNIKDYGKPLFYKGFFILSEKIQEK